MRRGKTLEMYFSGRWEGGSRDDFARRLRSEIAASSCPAAIRIVGRPLGGKAAGGADSRPCCAVSPLARFTPQAPGPQQPLEERPDLARCLPRIVCEERQPQVNRVLCLLLSHAATSLHQPPAPASISCVPLLFHSRTERRCGLHRRASGKSALSADLTHAFLSGHTRKRAAMKHGAETVWAWVEELDDEAAYMLLAWRLGCMP